MSMYVVLFEPLNSKSSNTHFRTCTAMIATCCYVSLRIDEAATCFCMGVSPIERRFNTTLTLQTDRIHPRV